MHLEGYIELYLRKHHHWVIPGVGTIHRVFRDAYLDHRVQIAYPGADSFTFSPEVLDSNPEWEHYLDQSGGAELLDKWKTVHRSWLDIWNETGKLEIKGLLDLIREGDSVRVESLSPHGLGSWYGLPSIPFYPLNRELAIERMALPKPKLPSGYRPEPFSFSKEIIMPILATALVLLAYVMIFTWPGNMVDLPPSRTTSRIELDDPRVNRSPVEDLDSGLTEDSFMSDEEMIDRAEPEQEMVSPEEEDEEYLDTLVNDPEYDKEMALDSDELMLDQIPLEALEKECIVIVGSFRRSSNVSRMALKLTDLGYEVYQEPGPGGLTRVGARLECLDEEILDTLRFFRGRFVEDAWVLKW